MSERVIVDRLGRRRVLSEDAWHRMMNGALVGARHRDHSARWRGRLSCPVGVHPIIKKIYDLLNSERTTLTEVAKRSGVSTETIKSWRTKGRGHGPGIANVVAVLNAIDYELRVVHVDHSKPGPKGKTAQAKSSSPDSTAAGAGELLPPPANT